MKGKNKAHKINRIVLMLLLLVFFSASLAFSALVSQEDVQIVVTKWIQLENNQKQYRLNKVDLNTQKIRDLIYEGEKIGYVVDLDPTGFAIVPTMTELSPVKFISFSSSYEGLEKHPFIETIKFRLHYTAFKLGYTKRAPLKIRAADLSGDTIDHIQKERNESIWNNLVSGSKALDLSNAFLSAVAPMLTSTWNQGDPYNMYTPMISGQHTPTGCVATAMAQVMYYWKYPTTGQGVHSYWWNAGSQTLSADFNHEYYWSKMVNYYIGSETFEQKDAVARLMSDVGISVDMSYGLGGSSAAFTTNNAFVSFFKYSGDIVRTHRSGVTSWDEWFNIFKGQMDNGWPALLATYPSEGAGHAIVIDGYRIEGGVNQVHANMGWGGASDNYYTIDEILSYGSLNDYALTNIYPPACSNTGIISGKVTDEMGNGLKNVQVQIYETNWIYKNFDHIKSAWTDGNGNYTADCLKPGSYEVYFYTTQTGNYVPQWYNGHIWSWEGDHVPVTAGKTTSGVNAQLVLGGSISGRVTDELGNPMGSVQIEVYKDGQHYWDYSNSKSNGDYLIERLPVGNFTVHFYPP
jgi:hypothetical protein